MCDYYTNELGHLPKGSQLLTYSTDYHSIFETNMSAEHSELFSYLVGQLSVCTHKMRIGCQDQYHSTQIKREYDLYPVAMLLLSAI